MAEVLHIKKLCQVQIELYIYCSYLVIVHSVSIINTHISESRFLADRYVEGTCPFCAYEVQLYFGVSRRYFLQH